MPTISHLWSKLFFPSVVERSFLCCVVSDDIHILWEYVETLCTQLNVQVNDQAMVAVAYDTRSVYSSTNRDSFEND